MKRCVKCTNIIRGISVDSMCFTCSEEIFKINKLLQPELEKPLFKEYHKKPKIKLVTAHVCDNCKLPEHELVAYDIARKIKKQFKLKHLCVVCLPELKEKYYKLKPKLIHGPKIKYQSEFDLPEKHVCSKCNDSKPIADFYIRTKKLKTGISVTIYPFCKKCHMKRRKPVSEISPQEAETRRQHYLTWYKKHINPNYKPRAKKNDTGNSRS